MNETNTFSLNLKEHQWWGINSLGVISVSKWQSQKCKVWLNQIFLTGKTNKQNPKQPLKQVF